MRKSRPIYLKAVDVLALLVVGMFIAGWVHAPFVVHSTPVLIISTLVALAGLLWFVRLLLAVRFLWTGREARLSDALRRRARPASP